MFDLAPPVVPERIAGERIVDMEQMECLGVSKKRRHARGIFQVGKQDGAESRFNERLHSFPGRAIRWGRSSDATPEGFPNTGTHIKAFVRHPPMGCHTRLL